MMAIATPMLQHDLAFALLHSLAAHPADGAVAGRAAGVCETACQHIFQCRLCNRSWTARAPVKLKANYLCRRRDAEVLSLFATIINRLQGAMEKEVPRIFEAVFEVTLTMITKNFEVRKHPLQCLHGPAMGRLWRGP